MTIPLIRKKLTDYIKTADETKLKAIYTMVEDEIETAANDWDDAFLNKLMQRSKSFKDGSAKTFSWEETKKAAINKAKNKK